MRKYCFFLLASMLAGCGGIPSVPYQEPPESDSTARIRVITNSSVFGDSITANCAPTPRHIMAESGRQYTNGTPHSTYQQYPLKTKKLVGMPNRTAQKMIDLKPNIQMAEGMYVEVEAEYLVPTNMPFQVATLGAVMGSYGSTNAVCRGDAKVFDLEAGEDYELIVGMTPRMTPDGGGLFCRLQLYKLIPIGKNGASLPLPVRANPAPQEWCEQ